MKRTSGIAGVCLAACLALGTAGAGIAAAAPGTSGADHSAADLAAARDAATAPATVETLSRFFARDGAVARSAAAPRAAGTTVPVRTLAPEFVAGKAGAPIARTEFLATKAVSSDGQIASVWAARQGAEWQVVNIATGDDEFRYARLGERKLPGGTVFREPQTDAWYVSGGTKVLPLDKDAIRAVGAKGTTVGAYRDRVRAAYGDKLPGSAYAKKGLAGGYEPAGQAAGAAVKTRAAASAESGRDTGAPSMIPVAAGAGAVLAVALCAVTALRLRRRA
ncbi:hypothetical protein [Streptomyces katsurahamanus]|uniref:Uncharacterized protein n=1 Tax=Streptomyces katsurahamanus TaxID=2577098 RepID=A0ABW9P3P2_9ACTN|nr:hypothetical protein [Streptomyces katsurahamanus]MQS40098.1 hypothetical protein [Streptomyces katsurahamanus]